MSDKHKKEMATLDITPTPGILKALGHIDLSASRCLAELVDNSIDSFLSAARTKKRVKTPKITLHIPQRDSDDSVSVKDNGIGMSRTELQNALRAGYSGKSPDDLGLFGVGFNIATARIGRVTEVKTKRAGDGHWSVATIDLNALEQNRSFKIPVRSEEDSQPGRQGTIITVSKIDSDIHRGFCRDRDKVIGDLGRIYSTMLGTQREPIGLTLVVNNHGKIAGREHCVWDAKRSREVQGFSDPISPRISLDFQLPEKSFCNSCFVWGDSGQKTCANCGSNKIEGRPRKITGWVGIQRYLDTGDGFGIDFVRNGRKIEIASKLLFSWGDGEPEYPIDDVGQRVRGRIVGEIHINHCRVVNKKTSFIRDQDWEEMCEKVRGTCSFLPEKRKESQLDRHNTSPLGKLHIAFRRNTPATPKKESKKRAREFRKLLLVPSEKNETAKKMAEKFRAGEEVYREDKPWWRMLPPDPDDPPPPQDAGDAGESEDSAEQKLGDDLTGGNIGLGTPGDTSPVSELGRDIEQSGEVASPSSLPQVALNRKRIESLSKKYVYHPEGAEFRVVAYSVDENDPAIPKDGDKCLPFALIQTARGEHEFYVNRRHPLLASGEISETSALLIVLAHEVIVGSEDHSSTAEDGSPMEFALVLSRLFADYGEQDKLRAGALQDDAERLLEDIAVAWRINSSERERQAAWDKMSKRHRHDTEEEIKKHAEGAEDLDSIVKSGQFMEFASPEVKLDAFEKDPGAFLDGRVWKDRYANVPPSVKSELLRKYVSLLSDVVWVTLTRRKYLDGADISRKNRARLSIQILMDARVNPRDSQQTEEGASVK